MRLAKCLKSRLAEKMQKNNKREKINHFSLSFDFQSIDLYFMFVTVLVTKSDVSPLCVSCDYGKTKESSLPQLFSKRKNEIFPQASEMSNGNGNKTTKKSSLFCILLWKTQKAAAYMVGV